MDYIFQEKGNKSITSCRESIFNSVKEPNTQVNPTPKPLFNDLDLPIALRKSSRSYTQHPLLNLLPMVL